MHIVRFGKFHHQRYRRAKHRNLAGEQEVIDERSASLYRIHGSNEPDKIGQAVSSGCIRMTNQDVIDLYNRIQIGATVIVQ
jgi:lipoprotein-anchoring transpeptidase ErfK/SrfK